LQILIGIIFIKLDFSLILFDLLDLMNQKQFNNIHMPLFSCDIYRVVAKIVWLVNPDAFFINQVLDDRDIAIMTMPINRVPSSCQISVFVICIIGDQQIENNYKLLFLIFVRGPSETGTQ
jgi:hypothetical protein